MNKLANGIIRFRWVIIGTVLVLTLFFGYQIRNISINSDIFSTLPDDDPTGHLYKRIGAQFGGNDIGMIVLKTEDVFQTHVLQHIKQITNSLGVISGISTVTSITNIIDIKSSEWGIEIGNLVDEYDLPDEQSELDSLRNYVYSKEMYNGAVVSEDGTATVILFTLLPDVDRQEIASCIPGCSNYSHWVCFICIWSIPDNDQGIWDLQRHWNFDCTIAVAVLRSCNYFRTIHACEKASCRKS